jgi:hypothetical protein
MKSLWLSFVLVLPLAAAVKSAYQPATLIDVDMTQGPNGYVRAGESFCLAISLDDFSYLLRYGPIWAYGYAPSDLVVGDRIHVRVKDGNMYLQKPNGRELKTQIVRRERNAPDKPPIKCGPAVAVRN